MYSMLNQAIAIERARSLRAASEANRLARQARRASIRVARVRAHESPVRTPTVIVTAAS